MICHGISDNLTDELNSETKSFYYESIMSIQSLYLKIILSRVKQILATKFDVNADNNGVKTCHYQIIL